MENEVFKIYKETTHKRWDTEFMKCLTSEELSVTVK